MQNNDTTVQDAIPASSRSDWLFERLPGWVIDTLSPEQKEAIHGAAVDASWSRPPINIRLSIPFFGRNYFVTVVGGESKRSAERRDHDKHRYPLRTAANVFFFLGVGAIFYLCALFAVALQSAIIEF